MLLFPYNGMYTIDFNRSYVAHTYVVKTNKVRVNISHLPYWKKDFMEASLNSYSKYIKHDNKVFLDDYLFNKFPRAYVHNSFVINLIPVKSKAILWPAWYARFGGYNITKGDTIEIWEYDFNYVKGQMIPIDSVSIYKIIAE